jgi:hypothetical protein
MALPATTPDRTTFFYSVKAGVLRLHVRRRRLLAKTQERKDHADDDNQTDQIDESIHEIPPVSVSNPPESNVQPNRKFRDAAERLRSVIRRTKTSEI